MTRHEPPQPPRSGRLSDIVEPLRLAMGAGLVVLATLYAQRTSPRSEAMNARLHKGA